MKRLISLVIVLVFLVSSFSFGALADDGTEEIVYLDNGYYLIFDGVFTSNTAITRSSNVMVVEGSKPGTIYRGESKVARVTVYGTFEYDGSSAEAVYAGYSYSKYNGWSFKSGEAYCSGNTAVASVTFGKFALPNVNLVLKLSCSPDGVLS